MFDWLVSAGIRFSSNGVVEFQRLAGSANMLTATLARQRGEITKGELAMLRYRERMNEIQISQLRLGNNAAMFGAGAGIAGMTVAVSEAANLQRQLSLIQIATGASNTQMERMRQLAYEVSNATAQSVSQSAQVIGVMASSGINQIQQLNHDFVMSVAKFADVQYLKSGGKVSFDEAAKQAIQLAHLYRAYTPQQISPILDDVTKLSFMMPDTLNRYLTQAGYYVPLFRRFGVPQQESLVLGAFMDRMGLGRGKGGTALQNFLTHMTSGLQMSTHAQSGMHDALVQLGILRANGAENPRIFRYDPKTGHSVIDIFAALQTINDSIDKQTAHMTGPEKAAKERQMIGMIQHAFGIQGARFGYLGDETGLKQLLGMLKQLPKMPGVNRAQGTLMGNLSGEFQRSVSNLTSVMTELGYPWLDDLSKFFSNLADDAHNFQVFLHAHKDIDKAIGGVVATGTTMLAARAGLGTLVLAIRGLGRAADATAIRIRADETIIGGGGPAGGRGRRRAVSAAEGAAAQAAAKAEGGGVLRTLDNLLFGGIGGIITAGATKVAGAAEHVLTIPVMNAMSKAGGYVKLLSKPFDSLALRLTATETLAGRAAGALLDFIAPLSGIVSVLGPAWVEWKYFLKPAIDNEKKYREQHPYDTRTATGMNYGYQTGAPTARDQYAINTTPLYNAIKKYGAKRALEGTHIHIEHLHLEDVQHPHDLIEKLQNLQRAPQTILRRSGAIVTHPKMPKGLMASPA